MNWTRLEREGFKPSSSLFDDGFEHVPQPRKRDAFAIVALLVLIIGVFSWVV